MYPIDCLCHSLRQNNSQKGVCSMYKELLNELKEYKSILKTIEDRKFPISISGVFGSQKSHMIYSLTSAVSQKIVYIASNEVEALHMYKDLEFFLDEGVVRFESREVVLYDLMARSSEDIHKRIKALEKIALGDFKILVTSVDAINQKVIHKKKLLDAVIEISLQDEINLQRLMEDLVSIGYEKSDLIEGPGQFSVRGYIIDIFPVGYDAPIRMELFGDNIDSIRLFDKDSQRSIESIDNFKILPARDLFYKEDEKEEIIARMAESEGAKECVARAKDDYLYSIQDKFWADIATASIFDYFDASVILFVDDINKLKEQSETTKRYHAELVNTFFEKGIITKSSYNIIFGYYEIESYIKKMDVVYLSLFDVPQEGSISFQMPAKQISSFNGHIEMFIDDLKKLKSSRHRILVMSRGEEKAKHLLEILDTYDIEAIYKDDFDYKVKKGQIVVTRGALNAGFEYPSIKLTVISDAEIFGAYKKKNRTKMFRKDTKVISVFTDLKIGDIVVHRAHGIGKYIGVDQLVVDKIRKDYIKIEYQDNNFLYVPINQLDLIQKYIGQDIKSPKLSKLNGKDWTSLKKRVKESVQDIAKDLIALYAKREKIKGFRFSKDTVWQKQFEDMFPYQETDAQLRSIEEVKKDMELPRPMERLLCGDVGFGKTEVALRAMFKACMDGKQVAYLVPTTVLARQQYTNFIERMKSFPVEVEVINRCKSVKQQKDILKRVASGEIDILIGTHRILQKDVRFKNLGLLVVDEEQRFGVKDKERIKADYSNIDVLSLSATPIPRTLHMSLSGIKDISVLDEAPKERYPVQTYVLEYDEDLIKSAILKEISRGGQIFYLYNNIQGIETKLAKIKNMIPEARVAAIHGRMNKLDLENTVIDFLDGEYDVLVCTTIIESGVDMPNVNTLIVEDADKMGLSQLYQIRGRVGRSNKLGYAYITYSKNKVLSEVSENRLKAIREFTEFGSGFKIAMRDMQIRGAGDLIGARQHGHIESVGYEMYTRLLENAIREQQGGIVDDADREIVIDLNVDSYIDNKYIVDMSQKIAMYKRIAAIRTKDDADDVYDELIDRFGSVPKEVDNLIQIALLKNEAVNAGINLVRQNKDVVMLKFDECKIDVANIGRVIVQYPRKLLLAAGKEPYLTYKVTDVDENSLVVNIKSLLQNINNVQI